MTLLAIILFVAGCCCCYIMNKASEAALQRKIQSAIDSGKTVRASQLAAAELESSPLKATQASSDDYPEGRRTRTSVDLALDDMETSSKPADDEVSPRSDGPYEVEGGWNLLQQAVATRARLAIDRKTARTRLRVDRARRVNQMSRYTTTPTRSSAKSSSPAPVVPTWDDAEPENEDAQIASKVKLEI